MGRANFFWRVCHIWFFRVSHSASPRGWLENTRNNVTQCAASSVNGSVGKTVLQALKIKLEALGKDVVRPIQHDWS